MRKRRLGAAIAVVCLVGCGDEGELDSLQVVQADITFTPEIAANAAEVVGYLWQDTVAGLPASTPVIVNGVAVQTVLNNPAANPVLRFSGRRGNTRAVVECIVKDAIGEVLARGITTEFDPSGFPGQAVAPTCVATGLNRPGQPVRSVLTLNDGAQIVDNTTVVTADLHCQSFTFDISLELNEVQGDAIQLYVRASDRLGGFAFDINNSFAGTLTAGFNDFGTFNLASANTPELFTFLVRDNSSSSPIDDAEVELIFVDREPQEEPEGYRAGTSLSIEYPCSQVPAPIDATYEFHAVAQLYIDPAEPRSGVRITTDGTHLTWALERSVGGVWDGLYDCMNTLPDSDFSGSQPAGLPDLLQIFAGPRDSDAPADTIELVPGATLCP